VSKGFGGGSSVANEQAAVIFKRPDGSHVYSTVAPQVTHDTFALRAQMPKGYTLSGIVHSHPGTDGDAYKFSPNDLDVANKLGVPSYIRFLGNNQMRKYVPGSTKTQTVGSGISKQTVAYGEPLLPEPTDQPTGALSAVPAPAPTGALAAASPDTSTQAPPTGALAQLSNAQ
jgi:hypothetical protein